MYELIEIAKKHIMSFCDGAMMELGLRGRVLCPGIGVSIIYLPLCSKAGDKHIGAFDKD